MLFGAFLGAKLSGEFFWRLPGSLSEWVMITIGGLLNSNYWNPNYVSSYYMAQLKEYAKNHGVRFIDLTDIIDSENLSHFSPRGGHYSIKGYKNLGKYLSHKLFLTKKRKFDVDQNSL